MKYLFIISILFYPFLSYSRIGGVITRAIKNSTQAVKKSVQPIKKIPEKTDGYNAIKPKEDFINPEDNKTITQKIKEESVHTTKDGITNIDKMLIDDDDDQIE